MLTQLSIRVILFQFKGLQSKKQQKYYSPIDMVGE